MKLLFALKLNKAYVLIKIITWKLNAGLKLNAKTVLGQVTLLYCTLNVLKNIVFQSAISA